MTTCRTEEVKILCGNSCQIKIHGILFGIKIKKEVKILKFRDV